MDPRVYRAAVDGYILPLRQAIESGPERLLQLTTQGENVVHIAVRSGQQSFISYVMGICPSVLAQPNSNGETPLHIAAKEGSIEMLTFLFRCLSNFGDRPEANEELLKMKEKLRDEEGRGPLRAVPRVLDIPPLSLYTGPASRTTLHKAIIMNSSEDEIREWAETFPEMITKKDAYGWSPLHYASDFGFRASVHILLAIDTCCAYEANKNGVYGHLLAAHKGHHSVIREFYESCPDCFELLDSEGCSALHIAAEAGKLEVVSFLIEKTHHHINLMDNRGYTPLLLASKSQNELFLASLRDHPKIRDSEVLLSQLEALNLEMPTPLTSKENDVSRRLKDKASIHLLVATLIATVSFAAGLNMPGGYRADAPYQGMSTLTKKKAFQAFVVSNSLAFCFSAASIAIHFMIIIERRVIKRAVLLLFALFLTSVGLIGMVVAFVSGTIAVLDFSIALCVAFSVFGFFFFSFFGFYLVFYVIIGLPSRKKESLDGNSRCWFPWVLLHDTQSV